MALKYILFFPGYLIIAISYFSPIGFEGRRAATSSYRLWKYKDYVAPVISLALYSLMGLMAWGWKPEPPSPEMPSLASTPPSRTDEVQAPHISGTNPQIETSKEQQLLPPPSPMIISISPTIQTATKHVDVVGTVLGANRLVKLKVDGKEVPFNSDGTFNFQKTVSIGNTDIKLVAIDEMGRSAEAIVNVTRSTPESSGIAYQQLNPEAIHANLRPEAIALIIGIDEYESAPPAEFGENDARSFYDYASNSLGIPSDRIKLLTGESARRLDIQKAIQNWIKPLIAQGKSDVFIFFSGHGLSTEDGNDMFLLPYDGDRNLLTDSSLRRKDIIGTIVEGHVSSLTLFLDTCYSGGTRGTETLVSSARPILIRSKDEDIPPNVTIIAASGNNQLSSVLAPTKHGLFSYYLMRGLEGEASGNGHAITASEMLEFLSKHVPAEAAKIGRVQTPQLVGDGGKVISSW